MVNKPFRIIETVNTLDGPRDRITEFCFSTLEEASFFMGIQHKEQNRGNGKKSDDRRI